ncbi:MAG: hypothetical protein IJX99_02200 [Clostridia bacterium]|nr:hypothetical protein [Clostridia bacterium]
MQKTTNYNLNKIEVEDAVEESIIALGENAEKIDGLIKNAEELFIATYGTTTFAQIQTAVNEGKIILLDYGGSHRLQLTYISAEQFNFAGFVDASNTLFNAVCKSTNEWLLESKEVGAGGNGNILTFENITVTTTEWVEDTTYEEFGYKADIPCTGVTDDFFSDVVFGVSEATSGNYAPISLTGAGTVTIYAVEAPESTITIPTIICSKGA